MKNESQRQQYPKSTQNVAGSKSTVNQNIQKGQKSKKQIIELEQSIDTSMFVSSDQLKQISQEQQKSLHLINDKSKKNNQQKQGARFQQNNTQNPKERLNDLWQRKQELEAKLHNIQQLQQVTVGQIQELQFGNKQKNTQQFITPMPNNKYNSNFNHCNATKSNEFFLAALQDISNDNGNQKHQFQNPSEQFHDSKNYSFADQESLSDNVQSTFQNNADISYTSTLTAEFAGKKNASNLLESQTSTEREDTNKVFSNVQSFRGLQQYPSPEPQEIIQTNRQSPHYSHKSPQQKVELNRESLSLQYGANNISQVQKINTPNIQRIIKLPEENKHTVNLEGKNKQLQGFSFCFCFK